MVGSQFSRYIDYRMYRLASLVKGAESVLDLGCAAIPNKYLSNRTVMGLDLNPSVLASNYQSVFQGDVLELPRPFGSDAFDAVIAGEVIEHIQTPIQFLAGCREVLKPNGKLVLSTPNPNSLFERLLTLTMSRSLFYDVEHVMLYPQRWLVRIAELAGFRNVRIMSGGLSPVSGLTVPFPRPWAEFSIMVAHK